MAVVWVRCIGRAEFGLSRRRWMKWETAGSFSLKQDVYYTQDSVTTRRTGIYVRPFAQGRLLLHWTEYGPRGLNVVSDQKESEVSLSWTQYTYKLSGVLPNWSFHGFFHIISHLKLPEYFLIWAFLHSLGLLPMFSWSKIWKVLKARVSTCFLGLRASKENNFGSLKNSIGESQS
jgi:hypothetical protein